MKFDLIINSLFELQDSDYKKFTQKLIPGIDKDLIIGVRVPALKKLAKELYRSNRELCLDYLENLPHRYIEENNLHAFLIENLSEYELTLKMTEKFLPFIDNWATCDLFSPRVFKKHPEEMYQKILIWLKSKQTYTVRYAIGLLLSNYLDKEFKSTILRLVADVDSQEYYIRMMIAWFFSTALVKQYDTTILYIENKSLEPWTHNKAIQKSIESRRISEERKNYLRSLKIKTHK